jgi:hypothetical protein
MGAYCASSVGGGGYWLWLAIDLVALVKARLNRCFTLGRGRRALELARADRSGGHAQALFSGGERPGRRTRAGGAHCGLE